MAQRTRLANGFGVAAIALAVAATVAPASAGGAVVGDVIETRLPTAPGENDTVTARDINNRGQIVGQAGRLAVLWQVDEAGRVGEPEVLGYGEARRINDRGQVLVFGDPRTPSVAKWFLWQDGQVTDIGRQDDGIIAEDLNEDGQVLLERPRGDVPVGADPVRQPQELALWDNGTATTVGPYQVFGPEDSSDPVIFDAHLSGDGAVVGSRSRTRCTPLDSWQACTSQAFVWRDGTFSDLPGTKAFATRGTAAGLVLGATVGQGGVVWSGGRRIPLGPYWPGLMIYQGSEMNERGQVAGQRQGAGASHAFRWDRGRITDLGTLGGTSSNAAAMNASGQIAGSSTTAGGALHAFLWDERGMTDLTRNLASTSSATGLNDQGQVIGSVGGGFNAFVWQVRV